MLISELDNNCRISNAKLLWGSANVLVLQPGRHGKGFWELVKQGKYHAIQLMTEATQGRITKCGQGFQWKEDPDR